MAEQRHSQSYLLTDPQPVALLDGVRSGLSAMRRCGPPRRLPAAGTMTTSTDHPGGTVPLAPGNGDHLAALAGAIVLHGGDAS